MKKKEEKAEKRKSRNDRYPIMPGGEVGKPALRAHVRAARGGERASSSVAIIRRGASVSSRAADSLESPRRKVGLRGGTIARDPRKKRRESERERARARALAIPLRSFVVRAPDARTDGRTDGNFTQNITCI